MGSDNVCLSKELCGSKIDILQIAFASETLSWVLMEKETHAGVSHHSYDIDFGTVDEFLLGSKWSKSVIPFSLESTKFFPLMAAQLLNCTDLRLNSCTLFTPHKTLQKLVSTIIIDSSLRWISQKFYSQLTFNSFKFLTVNSCKTF